MPSFFPTPDPVKITPLDLGEIKQENVKNALYDQRLQDMAYESNSLRTLNDVLRSNPSATGENVMAEMAARGFGKEGQAYSYNWLNRQRSALQYETDLRKEVSNVIGSVTDEASKGRAIDYLQQAFPHASTQFEQFRAVPWQEARNQGNTFLLGGAGRIAQQRQDAANVAAGYQPGMDLSTLHTAQGMQNAAAAEGRAAGLYPGQLKQQGATLEHTTASTESLRNKQQIVYGPDPNDWRGKKKIPGIVVPGENGGPGTFVPLQGVQGQPSDGSGGETQGAPTPQGGQIQGQQSQAAPVPGARQAQDGNWYVPDPNRPGKYLRVN